LGSKENGRLWEIFITFFKLVMGVPGAVANGTSVNELVRTNRKGNTSDRLIEVLVEVMGGR
jgi:hypothetical protein